MYNFKIDKKEEFLSGRTLSYLSQKVGVTKNYLSLILCGKKSCSKPLAYCLVKVISSEYEIDDFFERKEN